MKMHEYKYTNTIAPFNVHRTKLDFQIAKPPGRIESVSWDILPTIQRWPMTRLAQCQFSIVLQNLRPLTLTMDP